jgi:hypothetical protein
VQGLEFSNGITLVWSAPADPGAPPGGLRHDLLRTGAASNLGPRPACP